jgi:hypothetical protein
VAFTPRSAKNAKIRLSNVVHYAYEWSVTPKADEIDATNFEGSGFYEWIPGIVSATYNAKALYDCQGSPYDSPSSLTAGATLTTTKLYINDTTGAFWLFPTSRVLDAPTMANVKEGVKFDFNAKGSGTFTYPTGAST